MDTTFFDRSVSESVRRGLYARPAFLALQDLLSFGGRVPIDVSKKPLTDLECQIISYLEQEPTTTLSRADKSAIARDQCRFHIYVNSLGRFHIRPVSDELIEYPPWIENKVIGLLDLPTQLFLNAKARLQHTHELELGYQNELSAYFMEVEANGQVSSLLDLIDDAIRHVESVNMYVYDELWALTEGSTTLVKKGIQLGFEPILDRLRRTPVSLWSATDRLGVFSFITLYQSGRSIRFEEFNGMHLSATRLVKRFTELGHQYGLYFLDERAPSLISFTDKSKLLARVAASSVSRKSLRYRWISGISFYKTERLIPELRTQAQHVTISERLVNIYEELVNEKVSRSPNEEDFFRNLTTAAVSNDKTGLSMPHRGGATSSLEDVMQEIIAHALLETDSDYGMSSAIRNVRLLIQDSREEIIKQVLQLKPEHFYCAMVGRKVLRAKLGSMLNDVVYKKVQKRMQFNRWHFVPGNFSREEIPYSRHFYYPPLTPDLAEYSNVHHGGHSSAQVRYSVRVPGPDMSLPPLVIAGQEYRGFYDIRVVRRQGNPFSKSDLLICQQCCRWMGTVWRTIIDLAEQGHEIQVTGFKDGCGFEPDEHFAISGSQNENEESAYGTNTRR